MGFEKLGKKLMQLGQDTKTGVQKMSESYQINSKITEEKKTLSHLYEVIGQKIYEQNTETPLQGFEEEFEAIKASLENIQEYNDQLQQVKGVAVCPECGKEAAKGEKFCSGCGAKLPEFTDEIKADIKDAAGEAAGAAGEIVNDAIDKAKAFAKGLGSKVSSKDGTVVDAEGVVIDAEEAEQTEAGDAAEKAEDAAETMTDAAEDAAEAVADTVEDAAETATDTADAAETVAGTAAETAETVAEAATDAAETVTETAADAAETAADTAEAALGQKQQ